MQRLGYTRYVSQGGDWGAVIADAMARQAPPGLLGIHVNMRPSATVPPDIAQALDNGEPAPAGPDRRRRRRCSTRSRTFYKKGTGYAAMMGTRPQTIGLQPGGFAGGSGGVVL